MSTAHTDQNVIQNPTCRAFEVHGGAPLAWRLVSLVDRARGFAGTRLGIAVVFSGMVLGQLIARLENRLERCATVRV